MSEEDNMFVKSWSRIVDPVNKVGYMDGAADGQVAAFQPSFDLGFQLGIEAGIHVGQKNAIAKSTRLGDEQQIYQENFQQLVNCQLCLNNTNLQDIIVNLYNFQKEANVTLFTDT